MRCSYLKYSILSAVCSVVVCLTAVENSQAQMVSLSSAPTATTYNCFLDRNGDNSYTGAGEIGICTAITGTVSGELCPLDATDCVISMPTPTTCPSDTTYDSSVDKCVMPPVCPVGVFDKSSNMCVSKFVGACPSGASIDSNTGNCIVPPSCSSGSYNKALQKCVATSAPLCPSGTSLNSSTNRCEAVPACPEGGSYSSTDNVCIYSPGFDLPLVCPTGSTLDPGTGKCKSTSYFGPLCPDNSAAYEINSVPVCELDATPCPGDMPYSTLYKACAVTGTCPSGSQINQSAASPEEACIAFGYDVACPSGFTPDAVTGACEAVPGCPSGSNLDSNTNLCAAPPACTAGSYDVVSKQCLDMSAPPACPDNTSFYPATGLCDAIPTCENGEFDPSQGVCIKSVLPTCPFGGSFNPSAQRCEAVPSCSSGDVNPSTSMCAFTGPALYPVNCVSGTTLDTATSVCDAAPQCASGTYDSSAQLCSSTQTTGALCPSQTTLNLSTGKCEGPYTCPSCSSYSQASNACVFGTSSTDPVCPSPGAFNTYFGSSGCYVVEYIWSGCPSGYSLFYYDGWVGLLCRADAACPCGYYLSGGLCYPDAPVSVICPNGTTFDSATQLCEAAPSCPFGYTYNSSAPSVQTSCTATGFSSPTCITGTSFNSSGGRCEAQPTCAKGSFDPKYNACVSWGMTCPLGAQHTCLNNNGINQCSALACQDSSTLTQTDDDNQPTGYQTNNGSVDPTTGQCNGQLAIFSGKPSYCRPPGFRTVGSNCCSAAHGGKFSRYEDLNEVYDAALAKFKVFTNTTITNDSKNIAVDTIYSGNTNATGTHQAYTVTPGTPINWEQIIYDSGNDPTTDPDALIDYSSTTDANGLTSISTTVSPGYGNIYVYDAFKNPVSTTKFKLKATDLEQTFGFDSTTGNNINDIALTQYYYSPAQGVYDPKTNTTTYAPVEQVAYSIDTSTAACTIKNPSFEGYSQCQLQCATGLSNGNLIIKVVYRYLPTGAIISNAATVTKSVSGTSAQLDTNPAGCDDWISFGYRTYANLVKEPFVTASTAYNTNGTFNNNTIIAAESMGDMHTWPAIWSVVEAYASYITSPCRPHEEKTDLARDAGKCHYLGRFCVSHWGHYCIQDKESYCCFGSKLARIIQEQGRPQLSAFGADGGWGAPDGPICVGFTPDQFSMLDFSKMDLSEFYADIIPPNAQQIQQNISNAINNFYSNTINGGSAGTGSIISNPTGTTSPSVVSGPTGT
jgi:hypothetical protein